LRKPALIAQMTLDKEMLQEVVRRNMRHCMHIDRWRESLRSRATGLGYTYAAAGTAHFARR
jgi:hypothetical protein